MKSAWSIHLSSFFPYKIPAINQLEFDLSAGNLFRYPMIYPLDKLGVYSNTQKSARTQQEPMRRLKFFRVPACLPVPVIYGLNNS